MAINIQRFKQNDTPDPDHESAWLDWIRDEPVIPKPAPAPVFRPRTAYTQAKETASPTELRPRIAPTIQSTLVVSPLSEETPTISVNITVPTFRIPDKTRVIVKDSYSFVTKQTVELSRTIKAHRGGVVRLLCVFVVVLLAALGATKVIHSRASTTGSHTVAAVRSTGGEATSTSQPTFLPVVPRSKPELARPKAGTSSYDSKRNSYSYSDDFHDRSILVSEQPVPASFKNDSEAVTKIAQQVGAKEVILTNFGQAYSGTDSKSGQQTIVYAINGVLIFVQSPFSYTGNKWQPYLDSLQQPK